MTALYPQEVVLETASLGPENPLPPLRQPTSAQQVSNVDDLPEDMRESVSYGALHSVLPCLLQDGYTRARSRRSFPGLVLENELIRATVLPSRGGRLHSLFDKVAGRELLFANPAPQPANLALRDAWFAGGVEWNLGSTGHSTLTCEPMHAARVKGPDGTPMLRLWEWERTRNLVYQLDFWLPDNSPLLHVGIRVRNPHDHDVPLYWWSNIAVPQTPGTRVLVPATQAWHYGYSGRLDLVPVTTDMTYPMRHPGAADFFFDLPSGQQPWIAAMDDEGYGLAQVSTGALRGRKLFVWGESDGGRRWQDWLSPGTAHGYFEIQAGLARTQLEHLRLPAGYVRDWMEVYGPVAADPSSVHGPHWTSAVGAVDSALSSRRSGLGDSYTSWLRVATVEPEEWLFTGSGWGALEIRWMSASGVFPDIAGTPFPGQTLGARQRPWLELLQGSMPVADPADPPGETLVTDHWRALLEAAGSHWLTAYHRGVARWYAGDWHRAADAWAESVRYSSNPWALRNLARVAAVQKRLHEAAGLLRQALELAPVDRALAAETITVLLESGQAEAALTIIAALPASLAAHGRIKLLAAQALLSAGDARAAEEIFHDGFDVADIREGDTCLSDTWFAVQSALGADAPLPRRYDFRMTHSQS